MIPNQFLTSNPTLASYDWTDLQSAQGYIILYASAGEISTGATYFLTRNVVDSSYNYRYTEITNTNSTLTFDYPINRYSKIEGTAVIEWTQYHAANSTVNVELTLYHVSTGAVETSIGTVTGNTRTDVGATVTRECAPVTMTTKSFVPGEKIRLKVKLTGTQAGGSGTVRVYHDTGRNGTTEVGGDTVNTSIILNIPFKIDL